MHDAGRLPGGASDASARRAQLGFPPVDRPRSAYDIIDVRRTVAARHEVSAARAALAWVLAQPGVTSASVGARRPEQLADNLAAIGLELSDQDLADLGTVSARPPSCPGRIQSRRSAQRFPQQP
ncbi:aldo/keto reductase [Streptomyces sp. NPDC060223]|uniref:aldo/keto reductase n=1 Tax=unclassified Streptomyces TaxID=2593676 RepID=UPI0036399446